MLGDEKSRLALVHIVFLVTFACSAPALIGLASTTTIGVGSSMGGHGGGPLFNVTRVFNSGDVFSNADPRCEPKNCLVLGGTVVRSSPCHCQCPNRSPAFLQHIRQCANSIDECRMLEFNQSGAFQRIPTLYLPLTGQNIGPSSPIAWEGACQQFAFKIDISSGLLTSSGAGIQIASNGTAPCVIIGGGYLTQNGWAQLDSEDIFALTPSNGYPFLQWLGSKQDQAMLTGKVVQVPIRCNTDGVSSSAGDFCIVFRVIGQDVAPWMMDSSASAPPLGASVAGGSSSSNERANQLGLIVGIVCGALLAVTLVSVAVFWTVCWKQQKERLARKIQLHVLYQQQRMQQQAAAGAFPHLANALNTMNEPAVASTIEMLQNYGGVTYAQYLEAAQQQTWLDPQQQRHHEELSRQHYLVDQRGALAMPRNPSNDHRSGQSDQLVLPPPPPYPHTRRKLYFSPEFFDPDLMVDPPPVAEEFLYEVRRMIDLAKNRIRSRRYMPSLLGIPEEGSNLARETDRKMSGISNCSSTYSMDAQRRDSLILDRRDSFSKMAQEPAPEETLTIQEIEPGREQADSPRSSSDSGDSRTISAGVPSSSSSACEGGGDRSSGEAVSGGRVSLDSGLGGDLAKHPSRTSNGSQGDKVTHWLSRLPPTVEAEENEQNSEDGRHSKLFNYFNARQRLAQNHKINRLNGIDDRNIIRVRVNEDNGITSPQESSLAPRSNSLDLGADGAWSKRRYSLPLIDGNAPSSSNDCGRYKSPDISRLMPNTAAYLEHQQQLLRSRMQAMDGHNIDQGDQSKSMKAIANGVNHSLSGEWPKSSDAAYPRAYGSDSKLTTPKYTNGHDNENHDPPNWSRNVHDLPYADALPEVDYEDEDGPLQASLHNSSQPCSVAFQLE